MAKTQWIVSLAGLVALAGVVACQPVTPLETTKDPLAVPSIEDCDAAGGSVQRVGMMGLETCVVPTADANKVCTDSSQCQGRCIQWEASDNTSGKQKGVCQPTNVLFGCFSEVNIGKVGVALCVD